MKSMYKRQSVRFLTGRLPITVRPAGTFSWAQGTVLNLSRTGVQIMTSAIFSTGAKLEIEFNTLNKQGQQTRRKLKATVVWVKDGRYGCSFKPLSKTS